MSKQLDRQRAICPICNKEYPYLPAYKPVTCGKYDCVLKAHETNLIYANSAKGGDAYRQNNI